MMKKIVSSLCIISLTLGCSLSFADLTITSDKSVDENERIELLIETDNDYIWKINFTKRQYKKSDWDVRTSYTSSRTSSTHFNDYSTEWENGYYKMKSSDEWEKTISKFLKFKKEWFYKIFAEDAEWYSDSITIEVWDVWNNNDITLTANKKNPTVQQFINLTIETDEDYTGKLIFSAKYKENSDSNRTSIWNLTSSTYFSNYSYTWQDGYYKMKSSDEWEVTLKSLIKFKKEWYYRIYVKDTDDNEAYIQFSVDIDDEDEDEDNDNEDSENDEPIEDEIFIARNGKKYTIQYVPVLKIYTSKDLKKEEYFINTDYIKRYIDSKNPQKWSSNRWRIATSYLDKSDNEERFVAPNWKVYYITGKNWIYSSKQLSSWKSFSSIKQLKLFIRDHNPLIWM